MCTVVGFYLARMLDHLRRVATVGRDAGEPFAFLAGARPAAMNGPFVHLGELVSHRSYDPAPIPASWRFVIDC